MTARTNEYEGIDRDMSSFVVTTVHWGTRFYLADNESETATDMLARAKRFRWQDQAEEAAKRCDKELTSWDWQAMSVPEAMNSR